MADLTDVFESGFDRDKAISEGAMGALPAGSYIAIITASEMKPTKKRDGRYLELTFEVVEGDCRGRKFWARLNLDNKSEKARQIAKAEFALILKALGMQQPPRSSEELHGQPMRVDLDIETREYDGKTRTSNSPKGYHSPDSEPVAAASSDDGVKPSWA